MNEVTNRGAGLDFKYLHTLGPESIPALIWVRSKVKDRQFSDRAKAGIISLKEVLHEELHNWRGWTWRRWRLMRTVSD